jgi:hypothetical protein
LKVGAFIKMQFIKRGEVAQTFVFQLFKIHTITDKQRSKNERKQPLTGKDFTSIFALNNFCKEVLIPKSHCSLMIRSLEHPSRVRHFRLDGKPPPENDSSCGQFSILRSVRDGRRVCMHSDKDFKFSNLHIVKYFKLGAENPPLGNDTY